MMYFSGTEDGDGDPAMHDPFDDVQFGLSPHVKPIWAQINLTMLSCLGPRHDSND